MSFDEVLAAELWREVYAKGFDGWDCEDEVVRIAAICGLGVLSVAAKRAAAEQIRDDYRENRRYSRERYARLDVSACAARWSVALALAAKGYPTPLGRYPVVCPGDHEVGKGECFGMARKGAWTDECYRAAWGNTKPYGLEQATKACPFCGESMHYWCWGRHGDAKFRWAIDHVKSHARSGCTCHFNLGAIHPHCNSSKGRGIREQLAERNRESR